MGGCAYPLRDSPILADVWFYTRASDAWDEFVSQEGIVQIEDSDANMGAMSPNAARSPSSEPRPPHSPVSQEAAAILAGIDDPRDEAAPRTPKTPPPGGQREQADSIYKSSVDQDLVDDLEAAPSPLHKLVAGHAADVAEGDEEARRRETARRMGNFEGERDPNAVEVGFVLGVGVGPDLFYGRVIKLTTSEDQVIHATYTRTRTLTLALGETVHSCLLTYLLTYLPTYLLTYLGETVHSCRLCDFDV